MLVEINKDKEIDNIPETAIADWFKTLPKNLQGAILDAGIENKISNIASKYAFSKEKTVFLENEVLKFLIQLSTPNEFVKNISDVLLLNDESLEPLLLDLDENIFIPIEKRLGIETSEEKVPFQSAVPKDLEEKIRIVGQKNSLHIDELGILRGDIRKVLSGEMLSKDFTVVVTSKFKWDAQKINSVVKDINELIFRNIKESLREITSQAEIKPVRSIREITKDPYREGVPVNLPKIIEEVPNPITPKLKKEDVAKEMHAFLGNDMEVLKNKNIDTIVRESAPKLPINRLESGVSPEVIIQKPKDDKDFLKGNIENIVEEVVGGAGKVALITSPKKDIVEEKLLGTTVTEKKVINKLEESKPAVEAPKTGSDPYREPIK